MTIIRTFSVKNPKEFKQKMLSWANRFSIFCFLDHAVPDNPGTAAFDCLLGAGVAAQFQSWDQPDYSGLKQFAQQEKRWLFGHLSYPTDRRTTGIPFEQQFFFQPSFVLSLQGTECQVLVSAIDAGILIQEIEASGMPAWHSPTTPVSIVSNDSPDSYRLKIEALIQHIRRGDCYEINYCQSFRATNLPVDPIALYAALTAVSPNPFSACYKLNDRYCLCASPERYLQIQGSRVVSQPIKGTSPRFPDDAAADVQSASDLRHSAKEQRENVMVVDLVRNDLSRVCVPGSVQVTELFGIYSFPQVYQMISTIEGVRRPALDWVDVLEATFPMGSMTGAPKVRVMELIEQFETEPRGLFSGTIGYIRPDGDADFNVVIRSMFYQSSTETLEFKVGSGITAYCDPPSEYEECMWKAAAIRRLLVSES